mmetsp:Transcript_90382/g.260411  ORF Transcript_90382/g.260411 Transcript_90382/m.260411 type:complete len:202 (+) Transcript_90382:89-694(+)
MKRVLAEGVINTAISYPLSCCCGCFLGSRKGEEIIKCCLELVQFGIHIGHTTFTSFNTLFLCIGRFQFRQVLHDSTNQTIGTSLSFFIKGTVQIIQTRSQFAKIKFLAKIGSQIDLTVGGQGGFHFPHHGSILLDGLESILNIGGIKNFIINNGILGIQHSRRSGTNGTIFGRTSHSRKPNHDHHHSRCGLCQKVSPSRCC